MKRKATIMATALAAILMLVLANLSHLINVDQLRPALESYLQSTLGRKVQIGDLKVSLLAGGVAARDLAIADDPPFSAAPFVQAKELKVGVSLWSLVFSHSLHVTSLTLQNPEVALLRSSSGAWNFSTLGGASAPSDTDFSDDTSSSVPAFVLDKIRISNATLIIGSADPASARRVYQHVNFRARTANNGVMDFVLRAQSNDGATIDAEGKAGPIQGGNIAQTPFEAAVRIQGLSLADTALVAPSSLAGNIDLVGTLASNGSVLQSAGSGNATHLRVVRPGRAALQPLSFRYVTEYFLNRQAGFIRSADISTGSSHASLSGTYEMRGQDALLHMKLAGSHLALDDIKGLLPAFGVTLPGGSTLQGGTVDAHLALEGPVDRLVSSGNVNMTKAHLAGFNLGSRLSSIPVLSKLSTGSDLFILSLSSHFRIAADGVRVNDFKTDLSGIGGLSGKGVIDAANRLNFHVTAAMADGGLLSTVVSHIPGLSSMPHQIPFFVRGTTSDPQFAADKGFVASFVAGKIKDRIEQGFKGKASQSLQSVSQVLQGSTPCVPPPSANAQTAQQAKAGKGSNKIVGALHHIPFFGRKHKKQNNQVAAKY